MSEWLEVYRWLWQRLGRRGSRSPVRVARFTGIVVADVGRAVALALLSGGREVAFVAGRLVRLDLHGMPLRGGVATALTILLFGPFLSVLGVVHPDPSRTVQVDILEAGTVEVDGQALPVEGLGDALARRGARAAFVSVAHDASVRTVSDVTDAVVDVVDRVRWEIRSPDAPARPRR